MDDFKENVIEFLYNDKMATVTFTQGRFITKIKKLAEKYPDEVKITAQNEDGSIVAHIPVSYIHISNRSRDLSEEQLQELRERARNIRKSDLNKDETE